MQNWYAWFPIYTDIFTINWKRIPKEMFILRYQITGQRAISDASEVATQTHPFENLS